MLRRSARKTVSRSPQEQKASSSAPSSSSANPRKRALFSGSSQGAPEAKQSRVSANKSEKSLLTNVNVLTSETATVKAGITLSCGQGDTGQLGLGDAVTERKRFQPVKIPNGHEIVQSVCGGMHSVSLTSEGNVLTYGCNDESALGRKTDEEEENFMPEIVKFSDPVKVVQISAGDSHSAALDIVGRVFIWGIFRDGQGTLGLTSELMKPCTEPFKLENIPEVIKISSGYNHLLLLAGSGEVFSVGATEQGELGRVSRYQSVKGGRRGVQSVLNPGPVHFRGKNSMTNLWAFGYNSFFLNDKGVVFSCGLNNYGQTGTESSENNVYVPTKAKTLSEISVKQICGGDHHTLVLDNTGKVYALGRGDGGRLGIGFEPTDPEYFSAPQEVQGLSDVRTIGAGACVSYAVTNSGDLYAWGQCTNNQLGMGEEEDQLAPALVTSKQLENRNVLQVSGGGQHALCIVVDKDASDDPSPTVVVESAAVSDAQVTSVPQTGQEPVESGVIVEETNAEAPEEPEGTSNEVNKEQDDVEAAAAPASQSSENENEASTSESKTEDVEMTNTDAAADGSSVSGEGEKIEEVAPDSVNEVSEEQGEAVGLESSIEVEDGGGEEMSANGDMNGGEGGEEVMETDSQANGLEEMVADQDNHAPTEVNGHEAVEAAGEAQPKVSKVPAEEVVANGDGDVSQDMESDSTQ